MKTVPELIKDGHLQAAILVALDEAGPSTASQIWDIVYVPGVTNAKFGKVLDGMVAGGLIYRPSASFYLGNFAPIL